MFFRLDSVLLTDFQEVLRCVANGNTIFYDL